MRASSRASHDSSGATDLILKSGSLAYVDTFSGMIPCKVLGIRGISGIASSEQDVDVILTATRGAYKKGERLTWRGHKVVPRRAARFRKYGTRILQYHVQIDGQEIQPD